MKTTNSFQIKKFRFPWLVMLLLAGHVSLAQNSGENESLPEEEQIALRVARIAYVEGAVTVLRFTEEDWEKAEVNMPIMAGDKIFADVGARAEIQLEDQTTVRIGDDTFVAFPFLDDAVGRLEITKGKVNVHAAEVDYVRPPLEITSQNLMAVILDHGVVRLNVRESGETDLVVRRGEINVRKNDPSADSIEFKPVIRGQRLIANQPDPKTHQVVQFSGEDTFDQWSDVREAMIAARTNDPVVTPRVSGAGELNRFGDWVEVPEYGKVWRPRVIATDWAPYRDGRWVWREPYGWIWVSHEPWGWVPYHYGRWVHVNDYGWVWVPRETVVVPTIKHYHRPVWYPALVSFSYSSHGRHFGLSLGSGHYDSPVVGWFPLGVHDPYYPWYNPRHVFIGHHGSHHFHPHRSFHVSFGYYPHYSHHHFRPHHNFFHHHPHGNFHHDVHSFTHHGNHAFQNIHVDNSVTVVSQDDFVSGNTSRSRRVTIHRQAEPSIQTGEQAIASISNRREIQTRAAVSSNTDRVPSTPSQAVSRGSDTRTEPGRSIESRESRASSTANNNNWPAVDSRENGTNTARTASRADSPGEARNTNPVRESPRTVNTQRSRSTERTASAPSSSLNTNRGAREASVSRSVSPSRSEAPRSSIDRSNGTVNPAQRTPSTSSTRPRSTSNYVRETYANRDVNTRTAGRPQAGDVQRRSAGTAVTERDSRAPRQSNLSPGRSSSFTPSSSVQPSRQPSGRTINFSESRIRSTSNLPRVYSPNSNSNSRSNSPGVESSPSRNSGIFDLNINSNRSGFDSPRTVNPSSIQSQRSPSVSSFRNNTTRPSLGGLDSLRQPSVQSSRSSSLSRQPSLDVSRSSGRSSFNSTSRSNRSSVSRSSIGGFSSPTDRSSFSGSLSNSRSSASIRSSAGRSSGRSSMSFSAPRSGGFSRSGGISSSAGRSPSVSSSRSSSSRGGIGRSGGTSARR